MGYSEMFEILLTYWVGLLITIMIYASGTKPKNILTATVIGFLWPIAILAIALQLIFELSILLIALILMFMGWSFTVIGLDLLGSCLQSYSINICQLFIDVYNENEKQKIKDLKRESYFKKVKKRSDYYKNKSAEK